VLDAQRVLFTAQDALSTLSAGLSLAQTLFDSGRLRRQVDLSLSQREVLVTTYEAAVRSALKEVDDSLGNIDRGRRQTLAQRAVIEQALESLRLAELRYREGAGDLLAVLDAQRVLFTAQDALSTLSAGLSLAQTLFDSGRLRRQVDLSLSQREVLVTTYEAAVRSALKEVDDSLGNIDRGRRQTLAQRAVIEQALESLRLAELRYREGAGDLLAVLDAQRVLFTAQDALSTLSAGLSLAQTLFDSGRLRRQVDLSLSQREVLVTTYEAAVRSALKEVDDSLGNIDRGRRQTLAQRAVIEQALESLRLAELRYREGAGDLLAVLDAQRVLFTAQDALSTLSAGLSLAQTLFDSGRLRRQVDLSLSQREVLVTTYEAAVRSALKEVDDSLGNIDRGRRQTLAQRAVIEQALESLRLAELRYREGAGDLLAVLDAQRVLFTAQDALSTLRLSHLAATVDLYRALGGGWSAT
ncbi:MAG: TolC family protein, partial [Burkholderiaceae bacterium]